MDQLKLCQLATIVAKGSSFPNENAHSLVNMMAFSLLEAFRSSEIRFQFDYSGM